MGLLIRMGKFLLYGAFITPIACTFTDPQPSYETAVGEEVAFNVQLYGNEFYYWEWVNPKIQSSVRLKSRIYTKKFIFNKMRKTAIETWTFIGSKTGTDTVRLHLRTYKEDSLNIAVIDSVIAVIEVN